MRNDELNKLDLSSLNVLRINTFKNGKITKFGNDLIELLLKNHFSTLEISKLLGIDEVKIHACKTLIDYSKKKSLMRKQKHFFNF